MKEKYRVSVQGGCEPGAIGIHYPMSKIVMAESHDDALVKAAEVIDHIHLPCVTCVRTGTSVWGYPNREAD